MAGILDGADAHDGQYPYALGVAFGVVGECAGQSDHHEGHDGQQCTAGATRAALDWFLDWLTDH